ncbi:signal-induced proliferation-associated 1-like protein 2 isoform X2 [Anguilla anguilla]|uniref:signal-induced proliferation-associated 1-like protein 2 isoform X2 n=1 Tax=Anguilla anguilla TaxID=7936 RepID=UPI0015B31B01|nr:signal-induced proliferation-associated 1-like protein 2 isoform X2 [Anguilla anguilla]
MSDRSPSTDRANPPGGAGGHASVQSDEPLARATGPPGNKANGTPARPKMGVRARTSDWLPRTEGWEGRPLTDREAATSFQNGARGDAPPNSGDPALRYSLDNLLSVLPARGLHPVLQRSSSDVTISDMDADDPADRRALNPNTGASLRRAYGSASSIDQQGVCEDGLLTALWGGHADAPPARGPSAPSPSLQTAAQIARGEIAMDAAPPHAHEREKAVCQRRRADPSETASLFRKLRGGRGEQEGARLPGEQDGARRRHGARKCFAHYDVQSVLFHVGEALANRGSPGRRRNTSTGASAASQHPPPGGGAPAEPARGSREDLGEDRDADEGDGKSSELLLSCPFFRNEVGGEGERRISLSRASAPPYGAGEGCSFESSLSSHCTNAGVSVLEVPRENQPIHREKVKRYIIEHIDLGAYYYHKYFYGKEHQNYFGVDENLGPVALSVRRERLEDGRSKEGTQYAYRITFRTSELTALRGAILEDSVPSTARHGTARGLPLKEVLEEVLPELNTQCLRLALSSPHVSQQLVRLDEQGLSFQHKVGVLYCRAGQSTEEQMYNNESAGPAFTQFLDLLGQTVRLKGFSKYRAQLDNKTDSTGTHSLYTTYKDYELMFHVSTMLPYTPNNRQQLLRKRHIGNDIVTVVFQEPGALPFTPKNIRSHFQHIFIIVRVHNPGTESVCYSVAVSRSKDVPPFGPPIPKGVTFPKSAVFRDFLLAKVINGENAAHKSEKFRAMAARMRQESLRDLAANFASGAAVDSGAKFSFISLGAKRKEKTRPRHGAHLFSVGAITWSVLARDFARSAHLESLLAVSNEFIVLIEEESGNVVFNCSCRDVIGWSSAALSLKIFYERGECVMISALEDCQEDIREIVQRLEVVSRGCETVEMTLRRNGLGQLGFHVNFEGIVADVEPFGFAWQAGLRQGSRLVEICAVAVATLTHEQMIDLLRTSATVNVVIIQPQEDGTPRRGCSELYRVPMVEYKLDSQGTPCEYKTPFRRNTTWHRVPPPAGQAIPRASPTLQQASPSLPRTASFDRKLPDGSSNQSSSSDPGLCGSGQPGFETLQEHAADGRGGYGDRDTLREVVLERARSAEAKWHSPSTKILNSLKSEGGKDSPSKLSRVGERSCSSRSSSNTLSSNASSGSDDKRFGSGDLMDPELLGLTYIKGASTDSGIDTASSCLLAPPLAGLVGARVGLQWGELPEDSGLEEESAKIYLPSGHASSVTAPPLAGGSIGDLSEISSQSSGSHHSGSPAMRGRKISSSLDQSRVYIVPQGSVLPGTGPDVRTYPRQPPASKYLIGWKKAEDSPPLEEQGNLVECGRLYAAEATCRLRAAGRGPRLHHSLSKEEHLRMMLDSHQQENSRRAMSAAGSLSPHRSLCRTLSDESVCGNRKSSSYSGSHSSALDHALPNDILFSTTPPYRCTLPPRTAAGQGAANLRNEVWFSDGSLVDRTKFCEPSIMPLPDTVTGLDWSHLVDAARAFEDQRVAPFCTLTDMQRAEALQISQELRRRAAGVEAAVLEPGDSSPAILTDKVNQLEVILRQLQYDLQKVRADSFCVCMCFRCVCVFQVEVCVCVFQEKEDKAVLEEEVQHLRQDNMRLQEESQTATAQLRKFTDWFFHSTDKKP